MKTKQDYSLESEINAYLNATPADRRPETSFRMRIQSVAYSAKGWYEATTANGQTELVSADTLRSWIK